MDVRDWNIVAQADGTHREYIRVVPFWISIVQEYKHREEYVDSEFEYLEIGAGHDVTHRNWDGGRARRSVAVHRPRMCAKRHNDAERHLDPSLYGEIGQIHGIPGGSVFSLFFSPIWCLKPLFLRRCRLGLLTNAACSILFSLHEPEFREVQSMSHIYIPVLNSKVQGKVPVGLARKGQQKLSMAHDRTSMFQCRGMICVSKILQVVRLFSAPENTLCIRSNYRTGGTQRTLQNNDITCPNNDNMLHRLLIVKKFVNTHSSINQARSAPGWQASSRQSKSRCCKVVQSVSRRTTVKDKTKRTPGRDRKDL